MEGYLESFIVLVNGTKLTILVAMILVNFLLGIAVSIKSKTFRLKEIGDFMVSRVLPYILGYFSVGILAVVEPSWGGSGNRGLGSYPGCPSRCHTSQSEGNWY